MELLPMWKPKERLFILIMITAGILLRLVWAGDMEWKDDEKIMFNMAHQTAVKGEFPATGMMSGGGLVNPGMSVAVFAVMAVFTNTPLGMGRCVQIMNVVAILLLFLFIIRKIPGKEKMTWLYATALASVSPMAVLFSRKIWAQDTLPLFMVLLIICIASRTKPLAAFFYGVLAMIVGQIHMSGFFLAAGMMSFSLLHDLYHHRKVQWLYWIIGIGVGFLPLIPWLLYISEHQQNSYLTIDHVLQWRFYIYTFLEAHGLNLVYSFKNAINRFYSFPDFFGYSFYFVGILYFLLAAASVNTLWLIMKYGIDWIKKFKRSGLIDWIFNSGIARFYLNGVFIGMGLLMTFSGTEIFPHYLICIFPFSYLWLCSLYKERSSQLKLIIIAQFCLTVSFLVYVHQHHGIAGGDYGTTYHQQQINNSQ